VRSFRRSIAPILLAGALVAPASRVSAQTSQPHKDTGLGIQLLEAPVSERDDPRARVYVIDHVRAGASFSRRLGITNDTANPMHTELYVAPAAIDGGSFIVGARTDKGELASWGAIDPTSADLKPRETRDVSLHIAVPNGTADGEYYGGAVVEAAPQGGGPIKVAPRVAIRIYLSVGTGAAPKSDFRVSTLKAARAADGTPTVTATVKNIGERALDMSGQLTLDGGPAGLKAGPFAAQLGTTLAIGDTEPVRVILDKKIPNGPWHAKLTLRSGTIQHAVTATISFPDAGGTARVFEARPVKGKTFWGLIALLLLLAVLLGLLLWWWRRRKRDDDEDEDTPALVV
jgi:hypothetical protein